MSESGSSASDGDELMFQCKRCPGNKKFRAGEKDAHKQWHKEQRQQATPGGSRGRPR